MPSSRSPRDKTASIQVMVFSARAPLSLVVSVAFFSLTSDSLRALGYAAVLGSTPARGCLTKQLQGEGSLGSVSTMASTTCCSILAEAATKKKKTNKTKKTSATGGP